MTLFKYRAKRKAVRKDLETHGVRATFWPFLFPFPRSAFHMRFLHLAVFLIQLAPIVLLVARKRRVRLIHARSYPATLLALLCNKLLAIPYIFEMRGFFPEEGVIYGSYQRNSRDYSRWKTIEKSLIENSFSVIVESQPFRDYVDKIIHHPNISLIPCYVDPTVFKFNSNHRKDIRERLGISGKIVVTYCGTIGGWHDPDVQADYYLRIKKQIKNTHFLILTFSQNNPRVIETMKRKGLKRNEEYSLVNPINSEIPFYLSAGDVGLLAIADLPTARKAVSVKFVEYLSCGLPVICTPFVGGAAELIRKHNCGAVVDLDNDVTFQTLNTLIERNEDTQHRGYQLVREYLSLDVNARKFIQLYLSARLFSSHTE